MVDFSTFVYHNNYVLDLWNRVFFHPRKGSEMITLKRLEKTSVWVSVLFIVGVICGIIYISPGSAHLWEWPFRAGLDTAYSYLMSPVSSMRVLDLILILFIVVFINRR